MKKEDIIVIDIETVSSFPDFDSMDEEWKELWVEKIKKQLGPETDAGDCYRRRAAVMAEFGKVVCIGLGYFDGIDKQKFATRMFYGVNERLLLLDFITHLKYLKKRNIVWAGHNIREFDVPFVCRRLLVNDIRIPESLDIQQRKPWEVDMLDTFQFWRFGDYKNYTSLKLLARLFRISSSKKELDGSLVGALYWENDPIAQERNLIRIANYCKGDVLVAIQLVQKMKSFD